VAHAGDDVGTVGFDLHATAATKALLPAPEFVLYCVNRDGYAGREACKGCHQAFAVGLARRFEPEHVIETSILTEMLVLRHLTGKGSGKRRRRKRLVHITGDNSRVWFVVIVIVRHGFKLLPPFSDPNLGGSGRFRRMLRRTGCDATCIPPHLWSLRRPIGGSRRPGFRELEKTYPFGLGRAGALYVKPLKSLALAIVTSSLRSWSS
jgi:hypothetical protein